MADYIYLLQNRLTPAQRQTLDAVRDAARTHGMTVFLVGGAVRDLTSGTPVRDLDFAIQGDASSLIESLQATGATVAGENPALSAVYLIFPGGARAEIGSTLSVSYPKPGQAETQPAAILDDLRHRDFTANAMAISLNEGSYGLLLDPLNGVADIENRELRLVSNYGFIEQPALLLRAARLGERLGWTLEERTRGRYGTAREENYIAALPARDRGYELEEVFHEEDPLATLEHLNAEGWREVLFPAWTATQADRDGLERVHDLMGQLEQMGIHTDPSPVFFPLLTARLPADDLAELKRLFVRPGFVEQIDSLDTRSKNLANQLTAKSAAAPSETWRILFAAEPEAVLWLAYSSRSSAVQAKFRAFLNEWPQMRQRIPYALMQEMRITPELPGYEKLLDDLFFALIDGNLSTAEAARAFLEPYSPPAPTPQAAPRRRPAKAARSRSRKAATKVAAEAEEPEQATAEVAAPSESRAESKEAQAKAETPRKSKPSKAAGHAAAIAPATAATMPAKKATSETMPANVATAPASARTAAKPASAKSAVPVKTSPAPGKTSGRTASVPAKASSAAKKVAAARPVAVKAQSSKKTAAPAKSGKPAAKAPAKPVASKTAKAATSAGKKVAAKTTATKKAAAKKAAAPPRTISSSRKTAPTAGKAAKGAAAKGRNRR